MNMDMDSADTGDARRMIDESCSGDPSKALPLESL